MIQLQLFMENVKTISINVKKCLESDIEEESELEHESRNDLNEENYTVNFQVQKLFN